MAGVRPQKVLTFTQVDRLLKKELGAGYVDHFDREYAEWRIADEQQIQTVELPEEEDEMGLFTKLQAKGLDLSEVDANPFQLPDGRFKAVLAEVEHQEPKQEGYSEQLVFTFEILPNQPVTAMEKQAGKTKKDYQSIPTEEQFDLANSGDEKMQKIVEGAVSRTVQRLTQLGLTEEEIDTLTADEIHHKFRGRVYTFELNTVKGEGDKKDRQYLNNLRAWIDSGNTVESLLGEDDDE